jgi:Rrf2 family protein
VTTLTRKCQYALRALYFLANEYGKGPILTPRISSSVNAPPTFLQAILNELKTAGIVGSRRGPQGGFYLQIPPGRITVGAIIRIVDGPLTSLPCLGDGQACVDCPLPDGCPTKLLMRGIHEMLAGILDRTTLLPDSKPESGVSAAA